MSSKHLLLSVHVLDANLYRSSVSFQLLDLGQLHDCSANVAEALGGEIGAGDVLLEGSEVNARVLLGEAVCCYIRLLAQIVQWHGYNGDDVREEKTYVVSG